MTIYLVKLTDGQTFLMRADMVQASAPIWANFHSNREEDYQHTPFQTAQAGHVASSAAELVNNYFRSGPDDDADVENVTVIQ